MRPDFRSVSHNNNTNNNRRTRTRTHAGRRTHTHRYTSSHFGSRSVIRCEVAGWLSHGAGPVLGPHSQPFGAWARTEGGVEHGPASTSDVVSVAQPWLRLAGAAARRGKQRQRRADVPAPRRRSSSKRSLTRSSAPPRRASRRRSRPSTSRSASASLGERVDGLENKSNGHEKRFQRIDRELELVCAAPKSFERS